MKNRTQTAERSDARLNLSIFISSAKLSFITTFLIQVEGP